MRATLLALLVFLTPSFLNPSHTLRLILWNVGQGQWATLSDDDSCLHIDMGGEFYDVSALKKECGRKSNSVVFTHTDWDHISFLNQAHRNLPGLCKASSHHFQFKSRLKEIYEALPFCQPPAPLDFYGLNFYSVEEKDLLSRKSRRHKFSRNDLSLIWRPHPKVLIPGDSTIRAERVWLKKLESPKDIHFLILGHHGSLTSSSDELFRTLSRTKTLLVSARNSVYGHPHPKVSARAHQFKKPLLKTEHWGHLRIEL